MRTGVVLLAVMAVVLGAGSAWSQTVAESTAKQGRPPADDGLARAYTRPVPRFAEIRTIALTVLDDETSRPLSDAQVRVRNPIDFQNYVFRTDTGGRLRIEYPARRDEPVLIIEVAKDGYVPIGRGWGYDGDLALPAAWTFRLRRGTTMGGIVVAAAERPVEGVTVLVTVIRFSPGTGDANPTGKEYHAQLPSRTGPDGRWRIDSVPPGADGVELRLIHPDFVSDGAAIRGWPARSPTVAMLRERSDRQVVLRGLLVEGRVIDEQGRPIAGARIEDSTRGLDPSVFAWCHVTDAEGRFRAHLPRGKSIRLAVRAQGYVPAIQDVPPDPDRPPVEFRLERGRRLRGRVVDPSGHPIEGALANALGVSPKEIVGPDGKRAMAPDIPFRFHAWTDEHGRFDWDAAPAEAVMFHIKAEGYIDDGRSRLIAGDDVSEITLRPAVEVRLAAIDARTREAIPRYRVQIGTRDPATNGIRWGPRIIRRSTPRQFKLVLAAEEGPYEFELSADGYLPARLFVPKERTILRKTIALEKDSK
jgi:hypothetical protein